MTDDRLDLAQTIRASIFHLEGQLERWAEKPNPTERVPTQRRDDAARVLHAPLASNLQVGLTDAAWDKIRAIAIGDLSEQIAQLRAKYQAI